VCARARVSPLRNRLLAAAAQDQDASGRLFAAERRVAEAEALAGALREEAAEARRAAAEAHGAAAAADAQAAEGLAKAREAEAAGARCKGEVERLAAERAELAAQVKALEKEVGAWPALANLGYGTQVGASWPLLGCSRQLSRVDGRAFRIHWAAFFPAFICVRACVRACVCMRAYVCACGSVCSCANPSAVQGARRPLPPSAYVYARAYARVRARVPPCRQVKRLRRLESEKQVPEGRVAPLTPSLFPDFSPFHSSFHRSLPV
jgi:hypothetical protein